MVEVLMKWQKDTSGVASKTLGNSLISQSFAEKIIRDLSTVAYKGYMQEGVYCENYTARESAVSWKPLSAYYYGTVISAVEQQKEWCENFLLEIKKIICPHHLNLVIDVDIVY